MKKYIIEPINEFTYSLKITGEYASILNNMIKKYLKSSYYDTKLESIFFSAESIVTFKEYIISRSTNHIKMIDDLTKQINYLHKMGYGFYGFDVNDVIIIDNNFIFCSVEYLLPLYQDTIIFDCPIKMPYFSSPELFKLTNLPAEVNYKCVYYSLGVLVVLCLLNIYLLVGNEIKTAKEIDVILTPIKGTKIYWFIKRCIHEDIFKRTLLFI
jgi:hypothetical protein